MADVSFPDSGPGRSDFGNFVLSEITVQAHGVKNVKLSEATADFSQGGKPVADAIDGKLDTGWGIHSEEGRNHAAEFQIRPLLGAANRETTLTIMLAQEFGNHATLGKFRLYASAVLLNEKLTNGQPLPQDVSAALRIETAKRSKPQQDKVAAFYRSISPLLTPVRDELKKLEAKRSTLEKQGEAILSAAAEPHVVRVLPRGNWLDEKGEIITRGCRTFLNSDGTAPFKKS